MPSYKKTSTTLLPYSFFFESTVFTDKATCHNTLVYTRVELSNLAKESKKKQSLILKKPLN